MNLIQGILLSLLIGEDEFPSYVMNPYYVTQVIGLCYFPCQEPVV